MWVGHSIKHLMCIGGELEHHKALPSPARKNRAVGVLCSRARGIYRQLIGPSSWLEPGLKGSLWSRFRPPTGTNDGGPGVRHIGPDSCLEPGPKGPDELGPMPHDGPAAPLASRTETNGPRSWLTTIVPGWWLEPGPKAAL